MDDLHIGTQSVRFDAPPSILSFAAIGGKRSRKGRWPVILTFCPATRRSARKAGKRRRASCKTRALDTALHKLDVKYKDLDALFAGDLLNQCIGSAFCDARDWDSISRTLRRVLDDGRVAAAGKRSSERRIRPPRRGAHLVTLRLPPSGSTDSSRLWRPADTDGAVDGDGRRVLRGGARSRRPYVTGATAGGSSTSASKTQTIWAPRWPGGCRHAGAALSGLRRLPC